jgi:hypothetical protein
LTPYTKKFDAFLSKKTWKNDGKDPLFFFLRHFREREKLKQKKKKNTQYCKQWEWQP